MATHTYASFDEFKQKGELLYENLIKATNSPEWDHKLGSLKSTEILLDPGLVTDAQWKYFALRSLTHASLIDKPVASLLMGFRYEQDIVRVENGQYIVPNGNISGSLQGMYLFIEPDGRAHS